MQFSKITIIILILGIFSAFTCFEICRRSEKTVLNVIEPTIIEVDLNGNKIFDAGETVCIEQIEAFTANIAKNQSELSKALNITNQDALKLGYITDEFAEDLLSNKNVKLKFTGKENQNCKFADIYINKQSYKEKLLNSGLGFVNKTPVDDINFKNKLAKARKFNLVILNHKSNKFHTLDCKYGTIAHDAIIIPRKQIPNDAKPCKFCHIDNKSHQSLKTKEHFIPDYPLLISNGSIKMFLTDHSTTLKPDRKCNSPACKEVLNRINSAQNSIDIALYGYDNIPDITNALENAKKRGVKLRIVYDISTKSYYPETSKLLSLAAEISGDSPKVLMHNKFMIFDNKSLITGSMNFSSTGFSGFNTNCIFFINSQEIANIYTEEFNQMLSGKFSIMKTANSRKSIKLGKSVVTPLFSPKDKIITNNIIPLIESSKNYIYIPAFIITHDALTNSLIRAKHRGVDVKIILDATNTSGSRNKLKVLRMSGIPVKVENYAGKVHSKSIIIDDKYIIAGSMNFSNSGENKNDENVLIVEDERLARHYKGFFEYLWKKIPDKYLKQGVRAEGKYSIGSCTDGVDNNFDGKVDKEDAGCKTKI
ncbi:putative uncharacterized protein [Clostridium sp. CAG:967]|nr:putative uncharacterized protein [Clostridium sp. CAG:967]